MKTVILIILLAASFLVGATAFGQNNTNGNNQVVYNLDHKEPTTVESLTKNAELTNSIAIYKEEEHPIYKSKNDKLFIVVLSKNGNYYRKYIKEENHN